MLKTSSKVSMVKNKGNIVLTGGHAATTALATIKALNKLGPHEIFWVGSKYSMEGTKVLSIEFKIFPLMGVKCRWLVSGRLQRRWTKYSLLSLLKVPVGFLHALALIVLIRPNVVVSFGGFVALPVVFWAWVFRVPVIIHEQTITAGLANKLSARFANKIAISRIESAEFFPKNKTELTGNPVSEEFYKIKPRDTRGVPVILATGGSRGSQVFNQNMFNIIPILIKSYLVIHQCGELDLSSAKKIRNSLPINSRKRYEVISTISPLSMPEVFSKANMIIGRAGANTVSEVIAARKPAILIPIPWVQSDEQTKNAELAVKLGLAKMISQDRLSPQVLLGAIDEVVRRRGKVRLIDERIRNLDKFAARKLASLALSYVK